MGVSIRRQRSEERDPGIDQIEYLKNSGLLSACGHRDRFPQFHKKHNRSTGRIMNGRLRNDAFREKADVKNDSSLFFCQKLF
jgi:hypothetical protein